MWRATVSLIACVALAQTATQPPSFEVAEIKVNISGPGESRGDISNGRLTIRNVPLRYLIAEAWTVTQNQVQGPAWLDDVRVDIVAKAASPQTPDAEVRQMIQTLLRDRMKLAVHTEEREESAWALSVWKGQPKLTPSEMPARPEDASCEMKGDGAQVHFACKHLTMALLAHKLPQVSTGYVDKQVVDQTGLDGAWEIALDWTHSTRMETDGGMSLFSALQSPAGLQLTQKKLKATVLVVDSIGREPTE